MKNGLLVCSPSSRRKNVGDYIQSLAQEQFYDHIDCYVEREDLDSFHSSEMTNVIMNAWFMWKPEHFPPSDDIRPLFVSFHIVPSKAKQMLSEKGLNYLKRYEPIGARDMGTKRLLESKGIKCYFSGCLTLTLGLRYKSDKKADTYYFVDPYYEVCGMPENRYKIVPYCNAIINYIKYRRKVNKVIPQFIHEYRTLLGRISKRLEYVICATTFYAYYHCMFSEELLKRSIFIKHTMNVDDGMGNDYFMQKARELMCQYAQARLVVTSRIHCALPCLAVETPTIFVNSYALNNESIRSAGRLEGLVELCHQIMWTSKGLISLSEEVNQIMQEGKIGIGVKLDNPDRYLQLKENLIETVRKFVKK